MNKQEDVIYAKIGTGALLDVERLNEHINKIGKGIDGDELYSFIRPELISNLIEPTLELYNQGYKVVFRSSGAVGLGKAVNGITEETKKLPRNLKPVLAEIGQWRLMQVYQKMFKNNLLVGQLLPTEEDRNKGTFLETLNSNFKYNMMTIINENDPLDYSERDGNNDGPMVKDVIILDKYHHVNHVVSVGTEKGFYKNYDSANKKLIENIFYDKSLDSGLSVNDDKFKLPLTFKGLVGNIEDLIMDSNGTSSNGGKKERLKAIVDANRNRIDIIEGCYTDNLMNIISGIDCERTYYHSIMPKHL